MSFKALLYTTQLYTCCILQEDLWRPAISQYDNLSFPVSILQLSVVAITQFAEVY